MKNITLVFTEAIDYRLWENIKYVTKEKKGYVLRKRITRIVNSKGQVLSEKEVLFWDKLPKKPSKKEIEIETKKIRDSADVELWCDICGDLICYVRPFDLEGSKFVCKKCKK